MDGKTGPGAGNQGAVLSKRRGDNMEYQETMTAIHDFFATDGRARGHKSERQDKFNSLMRELHQYASAFQLRFIYGLTEPKGALREPEDYLQEDYNLRAKVRQYCRRSAFLVEENPTSKAKNQWLCITETPRDIEAARIFQAAGIPAISIAWNPPKIAAKMPWQPDEDESDLIDELEEKPAKKGPKHRRLARILKKYAPTGDPWIIIQDNTDN